MLVTPIPERGEGIGIIIVLIEEGKVEKYGGKWNEKCYERILVIAVTTHGLVLTAIVTTGTSHFIYSFDY